MKTEIHPEYVEAQVTCTCGNAFTTRSTTATLNVEICSNCHPFYTGKQKLMDTGGRVERFRRRAAKKSAQDAKAAASAKSAEAGAGAAAPTPAPAATEPAATEAADTANA